MSRVSTLFLSIALITPMHGESSNEGRAAAKFVANFYLWYTPIALRNHRDPALGLALKHRKECFSPELRNALQEDLNAQLKANPLIVGLDGDPFLMSQDPEAHHKIGKITPKGDSFWIEVHGVRSGKPFPEPAVIPEVRRLNGNWVFVNFHSIDGWNVLDLLKSLKKNRLKAGQ